MIDEELMQYRSPVGGGPSLKTWPRCDPQRRQVTSVRTMKCDAIFVLGDRVALHAVDRRR